MSTTRAATAAPGHTQSVYTDPKSFSELVSRMTKHLRAIQKVAPFTMLAGCGNSAAPLLGALGLRLQMPIISVRKSTDYDHHDYHKANGFLVDGAYLIIDDLISSGRTVTHIQTTIAELGRRYGFPDIRAAGILLYCGAGYDDAHHNEIPIFYLNRPVARVVVPVPTFPYISYDSVIS